MLRIHKSLYDETKAENAELIQSIKNCQTYAIKEFAEELKPYRYTSSDWSHGEHPMVVEWDDVENVLYRMTEVDDGE